MDAVTEADEKMVRAVARGFGSYCGRNVDMDDLLQAGFVGLMRARANFDASRGFKFETLARHYVRGHMLDAVNVAVYQSSKAKNERSSHGVTFHDATTLDLSVPAPTVEDSAVEACLALTRGLSRRQRLIALLTFGLGMTDVEASRVVSVVPTRVGQVRAAAAEHMRRRWLLGRALPRWATPQPRICARG